MDDPVDVVFRFIMAIAMLVLILGIPFAIYNDHERTVSCESHGGHIYGGRTSFCIKNGIIIDAYTGEVLK